MEGGDGAGEAFDVGGGEVGEEDDGESVIDVALDDALEALPGAGVVDEAVAIDLDDEPAKAVGVGLAVGEGDGRPHVVEAGLREEFFGGKGGIP